MGSRVQRTDILRVLSDAAVAVNSFEYRLGGNDWDVQFVSPAGTTLNSIEGSNDKVNWVALNDIGNSPITGLGSVMRVGLERPKWIRFQVAVDAGGPRQFSAIINVQKRAHGS